MLQISNTFIVAEVFFNEPTKKHYLIEISKKAKLAHTSVKRLLKELVKENIIKEDIEIKGKRKFPVYSSNINLNEYKRYKTIYNLIHIEKSGVIDFLRSKLMPNSIILFGSYSRGEDIETSDIDIFIQTKDEKINLGVYEKKLKRKIQLHFRDNFNSYPKELKNNILNGKVLYGYIEVFK